jgi:glutathione synthase/RimK-type ligase-like ATP-grasp enzyme
MVLLWGIATDSPLAQVRAALERIAAPVIFLDQQTLLRIELEMTVERAVQGTLCLPEQEIALDSVDAVYLRPYDVRRILAMQGAAPQSREWHQAIRLEDALLSWIEMTPAFVVNRPSAMASNNSKPYQARLIESQGFGVPDTLVTTDVAAALEFWEKHGSVIYKSISGIRSIVSRLRPEHRERLNDVANCPTQFQEYIEGTDFRVHVVGNDIFACEIRSTADDYRYPDLQNGGVQICPFTPQADLADRCRALAASLKLPVAGIDLRRTPGGKWYCFEVNPSPGFSFYEDATGQTISGAIAKLLTQARCATSSGG